MNVLGETITALSSMPVASVAAWTIVKGKKSFANDISRIRNTVFYFDDIDWIFMPLVWQEKNTLSGVF